MEESSYKFDFPTHHTSIIKVMGVGGGGSNAVDHMFRQGIKDVEFIVCNTDHQALEKSVVPNKLQIGNNLTGGLGVGANPEIGKNAAIESKAEIRDLLSKDTKMLFITAGMGGGTGTGAAPIIAQVARDLDILTVGIVTSPFSFEGKKKMSAAKEGIKELKKCCDTVLEIMNERLFQIYGNLSLVEAYAKADNILTTSAKSIAELITVAGTVNVDFEDVKTVIKNAGPAVIGSAIVMGENRARRATEEALNSPLLNQQSIQGAEKVLISIRHGEEEDLNVDEFNEITGYIKDCAGDNAMMIYGVGSDSTLKKNILVTVVATGFGGVNSDGEYISKDEKKVFDLDSQREIDPKKGNNSVFTFEPEEEKDTKDYTETFDLLKNKIKRELDEEEKDNKSEEQSSTEFDFDFTENFDINEEKDIDEEGVNNAFTESSGNSRKRQLEKERVEREKTFTGHKYEVKMNEHRKSNTPAYKLKEIKLEKVPDSSDRTISQFTMNDDNKILKNNRFLHDKMD